MSKAFLLLFAGITLTGNLSALTWPLDAPEEAGILLRGGAVPASGAQGQSLVLDGSSLIELKDTAALSDPAPAGFTVSLWFNPYELKGGQQMLAGKNRYSDNEREWGITLEADGTLRAHLRQDGRWAVIPCGQPLRAGQWHLAALTVGGGKAALYLNGQPAGEIPLPKPLPVTKAPVTVGGIWDRNAARQTFRGALDEVRFEPRAWSAAEVAAFYRPVTATHELPKPWTAEFPLWDEREKLAEAKDLPVLQGVEFHVIQKWDQAGDGYVFLHGVALAWHRGKLYASFAHNKGQENTVTEEAHFRVSEDGGRTWGPLGVIDAGEEENLAVSHGVFLSQAGILWAFHGAFRNRMEQIHTRAYSLDEATGAWIKRGVVVENGFWALNQPVPLADGNWLLPGISAGAYSERNTNPPAVAISQGGDFTRWSFVSIPAPRGMRVWGESSVLAGGAEVWNISRYGAKPLALISRSRDHGRTWTTVGESNLPMATSKPAAGVLSNGQRYLVCTTAAGNGGRRNPLTIAVSRPGEELLSQVFVIRHALHPGQPGESAESLSLSYPYATEQDGKLYVGYSNNGGRRGNLNSAELAIIPVAALQASSPGRR